MTPVHIFQLVLGALAVALILPIATRRLPIPPAASLVLGGMLLAGIPGTPAIEIDPDLVMLLFLPPLLLSSAAFTVWRDFRAELRPILLLAIGAVTFTTLLVGCAAKWAIPALPWGACFALGAIVSPPDAVAAKAVMHHLPLPRRLVTILEGESLVNDASGLLLYRFAVAAALTGVFHPLQAAASFLWLSVGGVLFGLAAGRATLWVMSRLRSPQENILLSFLTAWVTYLSADLLGISGVLSVVACGLLMGWRQHELTFSARNRVELRAVWRVVVTVFETLVFVLIGLSLRGVVSRLGNFTTALHQAVPFALTVVIAVLVTRFLWVIPGMYLSRAVSPALRKNDPFDPAIGLIASWAGMRGVVSLAAALALPIAFPGRDLLLFATFSVIAVTVLIQGATLGPLIRVVLKSRPADPPGPEYDEFAARQRINTASLQYLTQIAAQGGSTAHHHRLVEHYQQRLEMTNIAGSMGAHGLELRESHFGAALAALAAGRTELVQLHHAGLLHDTIVRALESEMDLEELRLRRLAGEQEL